MPKKSDNTNIKLDAEKYDKKTQREHILLRPDTYIGDIESTTELMYVYDSVNNKIIKENITYTPGFMKIFDEALINARDALVNDPSCDTIKVEYSVDEGYISVYNNGDIGIPVEEHPIHKQMVPSMIFGELLTSSNYDDTQERTTGGRNGIGSKAINIFSTKFIVEICDAKRNKFFIQEWTDNMLNTTGPTISKLSVKTKSSVKITFYPDFQRFNIKDLNNDHLNLFHRRTIDIAGVSPLKLKVFFNDNKVNITSFKSYIELYNDSTLYYDEIDRWSVGVIYNNSGNSDTISFVNGINTFRGGTHCNHVIDNITKTLINDYMKKKDKDVKITTTLLKDNLIFFINSVIVNPAFSSQTKDTLTTKIDKFGSKYEPSIAFLKKLSKCGILEHALELAKLKESSSLKKTDGKKQIKITGIPKLEDANKAGSKDSYKCTLILTEGDSAKATAMAGLSVIGRDYFGVFPLKGKMLNVREATNIQLLNNEEIKHLKTIIGLKQGEDYSSDVKFNTLRYGHVLMLTDSDVDGSHIKGLFMNMVHSLWPSLIKRTEFIQSLHTPIVKATKGKEIISFYNLVEYENWIIKTKDSKNYKVKYYKGLGTSTSLEAKEYFTDINQKLITYLWENQNKEIKPDDEENELFVDKPTCEDDDSESENIDTCNDSEAFIPIHDDDDALRLAFDKRRADDRKKWLKNYDKNNILKYEQKQIPYYDFVHSDLIHFSNEDLIRSIPSVIDGLKPSHRKILYGSILRGLDKDEIKVSQLAGFVSDKAAYHHGEMSLNGAIIGMAQDYVGSNNINILKPNGQFGCLAPETPILMWNGSIKRADAIVIGDELVGDDGMVRNVNEITNGNDNMYKITTEYNQEYTVNSEHIITLYYKNNNVIKHKKSNNLYYFNYFDGKSIKSLSIKYNLNILNNDHFNKSKITKESAYNHILEKQQIIKNKYNISNIIDIKISDYIELSKHNKSELFMISNTNVINWKKQPVKIDPYILGAWLGDGNHEGNGITSIDTEILKAFALWLDTINCEMTHHTNGINHENYHYGIRRKGTGYIIPIGDKEHSSKTCVGCCTSKKKSPICDCVFEKLPTQLLSEQKELINDTKVKMFYNTNPFKHLLKEMNLYKNKHIPKEYLYNDEETRLQLLAGFIDTDGCVKSQKNNQICVISQSKKIHSNLIYELEYLCKTLGFSTSIYSSTYKKTIKGEDITMLILSIMGEHLYKIPTKLPRKKIIDYRNKRIFVYNNYMNFTIKEIGIGPFNGWALDGNERFLLGNFIVTHNSRLRAGKDFASSRYIWTMLETLTPLIFNSQDTPLLNNLTDDGMPIEPEYYVPIIPMVLVNGTEGIGTGFSTKIPPFNPINIIDNLINMMNNKPIDEMYPWWQGYKGSIIKINNTSFEAKSVWEIKDNKLIITELPIGEATANYKEFLEKMLAGTPMRNSTIKKPKTKSNPLLSYIDNNTDTQVYFELTFEDGFLSDKTDIEKIYKLSKKISLNNMHLYSPLGKIKKYNTIEEIMRDYYDIRIKLYEDRKEHQLKLLKHQLSIISNKLRFILMVVNDELIVNKKKKSALEFELESHKFPLLGRTINDTNISYDYLLSMPIYNLTLEKIEELQKQEDKNTAEYNTLLELSSNTMWLNELLDLKEKYNNWTSKKMIESHPSQTLTKKKKGK